LDLVPKLKSSAIQEWFGRLPGNIGIANVRYTTSGKCDEQSIVQGTQPMTAEEGGIKIAVSFNGNIVNTQQLLQEMKGHFSNFVCSCDSDLVCNKLLIELKNGKSLPEAVKTTMLALDGAFSVLAITGEDNFLPSKTPRHKATLRGTQRRRQNLGFLLRIRQFRH
jgi:glutamine phosphoribosylpyrophosphate amidotransferase